MTSPSLRRSLFGRTWSIVSPARRERPQPNSTGDTRCPFCEGNERDTEQEVFALRKEGSRPNEAGWTVRVVPNKYPALSPSAGALDSEGEPFVQAAAQGIHEVVVETSVHEEMLSRSTPDQLATILSVYQSRVIALSRESGVRSVVVIKNEGKEAGASQRHSHSQILALPQVHPRLAHELAEAGRHFEAVGSCLTCQMLQREMQEGRRLVVQNADFAALTSFAPRFPYETWIVPKAHSDDFRGTSQPQLRSLAQILLSVLAALESVHGAFPYNLVLQTAPVDVSPGLERAFHWRLELMPRLTTPSGLELGCDTFIVAVTPERAAEALRAAM